MHRVAILIKIRVRNLNALLNDLGFSATTHYLLPINIHLVKQRDNAILQLYHRDWFPLPMQIQCQSVITLSRTEKER